MQKYVYKPAKREYVTNRLKFPSNYLLIGEFLSRLVHALCMFQGKQASQKHSKLPRARAMGLPGESNQVLVHQAG